MSEFDDAVKTAVTRHMNDDHTEDSVLIARAFGYPEATSAVMTGLSNEGGEWRVTDPSGEHDLGVPWPSGRISERPQIRREVVFLYRAACEKLGVPWRDEEAPSQGGASQDGGHGANANGSHGHGANTHGANGHEAQDHARAPKHGSSADGSDDSSGAPEPFSAQLRKGTWSDHSDSEGAGFMEDIMRARATFDDYVALAVQHHAMYEALEEVSERFASDPFFQPLHPEGLVRMRALEADLKHLLGENWREQIEPLPATVAYASRIREIGDEGWLGGVIAHHYTRYLGDLSGGQMIARRVAKQHGFSEEGVQFYAFPELGDLNEFKNHYRSVLDSYGETLTEEERRRVVDEVRIAYRFNTDVFVELSRAKSAA